MGLPVRPSPRPLEWIASSRADLRKFPEDVRKEMGHSLHLAQLGERPNNAKPLKGFGVTGVLEVLASHESGTFRAVYTVKFAEVVYVLHAFQKKSKQGIATPRSDIELIKRRLRIAEEHYQQTFRKRPT
jgi:phage-related protein